MSELADATRMLKAAEEAAGAENLPLADQLLRRVAHIQEVELGPLHPDLANTLNNLAIVAEKEGRIDEAESFYRRAVAITSESLPVDHPMATASRENLEDFCRSRGLRIDKPSEIPALDIGRATAATAQPSSAHRPVPEQRTAPASEPSHSGSGGASRSLVWAAIAIVVAIAAFLFMRGPSPSGEAPATGPTAELKVPPQVAEPALPPRAQPPVTPAPIEQPQAQKVVPQTEARSGDTGAPSDRSPATDGITLATAQLCRSFSIDGTVWQCDPIPDRVSTGPIVLYTRVRSPRDVTVVHRWYRGDTLRQSVELTIRANATEGYRTYSRQTVDNAEDWRVEVRSANGELLFERRFAVK